MNTTTESPDISSTKARRRAMGLLAAGAAAVALFALGGTAWPGAAEAAVASAPMQLVDQATAPPLRVQDVDDASDENNAIQSMIQSEQQAQEQNDQAEEQAQQDEQQALQDEQQANQ
jgi:hypothetical protein